MADADREELAQIPSRCHIAERGRPRGGDEHFGAYCHQMSRGNEGRHPIYSRHENEESDDEDHQTPRKDPSSPSIPRTVAVAVSMAVIPARVTESPAALALANPMSDQDRPDKSIPLNGGRLRDRRHDRF